IFDIPRICLWAHRSCCGRGSLPSVRVEQEMGGHDNRRRMRDRPHWTGYVAFSTLLSVVYHSNLRPLAPGDSLQASLIPSSIILDGSITLDRFGPYINSHVPYARRSSTNRAVIGIADTLSQALFWWRRCIFRSPLGYGISRRASC